VRNSGEPREEIHPHSMGKNNTNLKQISFTRFLATKAYPNPKTKFIIVYSIQFVHIISLLTVTLSNSSKVTVVMAANLDCIGWSRRIGALVPNPFLGVGIIWLVSFLLVLVPCEFQMGWPENVSNLENFSVVSCIAHLRQILYIAN